MPLATTGALAQARLMRDDFGAVGIGLRQRSTLWQRTIFLKAGLSVTLRDRWE
jgi:hypothetical protein